LFVLFGNVQDLVLHDQKLVGISDFLAHTVLAKKDTVIRYNVSTGCRFAKKSTRLGSLEELLNERAPDKVLPALEQLLFTNNNLALVVEYAEAVAPAGDASFSSDQDRLAVVTFQRWSMAPQLENSDNVVILLSEVPSELHPKIVSNPKVAAVSVPMPGIDERLKIIEQVNPVLDRAWSERLADVSAGLKAVQIKGILQPSPPETEDADKRFQFIQSLIKNEARARKLAAVTQGMSHDEIEELIGVPADSPAPEAAPGREFDDVLRLIARRKREIIERECFGLIEFVEPAHDFSIVGGIDEVKKELLAVARNIREGHRNRVPMGILFTGPMGTGKTFVAEAFVKESGLTSIKLKNFRSKWVGATESNLERILGVVQAIGNVIVIIDEGDRSFGSGGEGGESDGGTSSRVIARLKEFMSDTSNRGRVLFIVMTNRPDKLDVDIKRAGRLDRKIPFLYAQTPEEVEMILAAQLRKQRLESHLQFPRDRTIVSAKIIGYSNAEIEGVTLLANDYATEKSGTDAPIPVECFEQAIADYLPSRDIDMLEYMELLAVFEASNRRMLPAKYASLTIDELQARLAELRIKCGGRR